MSDDMTKEVRDWEHKFAGCVSSRQIFEEQWYYNMAFYFGRQWAVWDKTGVSSRLIEPPAPRNRVRLVSNKVKPAIRREITKLTKEEPQFYVVPSTTEPDDVAAAKVAENLAEFVLTKGKFNSCRRKATFWTSICGNGFIKVYCPDFNADIIYENVTPFHLYVPYIQEETIEAQPYIIHARALSPETLSDKYGADVKPDSVVTGGTLEQRFFNALGIKSQGNNKDLSMTKEIWIKPCRNYPKGAFIVIADKKVIYAYEGLNDTVREVDSILPQNTETMSISDFPYEHGSYPFHKFDHIPSGRFYSGSIIDDLIPLQKEYNKSRSQIIESKNRTAKPAMVYVKGSIEPNKITSEPGLMIPVNPGFEKPAYLVQPEMPSYVLQELDRIQSDMDDVTNQFEVAKGRTPPGVEAASAIAYLQEENDDVLHMTIASIEQAVEDIGKQSLSLVQQFWNDEKIVTIVSKNNAQETMIFRASDINNNVDLRIESQSMAPRSRAAKQAFITGLIKDGIIQPDQGLRYLQMNETNRLYDEMQVDSKQAKRENFRMTKELFPEGFPTNDYDNDQIHAYEHALFMKTQEYEVLDSMLQEQLLAHFRGHNQILQLQAQTQQLTGQEEPAQ